MNGAESTKSYILQTLSDTLLDMQRGGCSVGKINAEKIHHLETNNIDIKSTLSKINDKLFWGLVIMIIVGFLAGVNVMTNLQIIPK
jgi:hypothetical protein